VPLERNSQSLMAGWKSGADPWILWGVVVKVGVTTAGKAENGERRAMMAVATVIISRRFFMSKFTSLTALLYYFRAWRLGISAFYLWHMDVLIIYCHPCLVWPRIKYVCGHHGKNHGIHAKPGMLSLDDPCLFDPGQYVHENAEVLDPVPHVVLHQKK
jgi:hypothetical protein